LPRSNVRCGYRAEIRVIFGDLAVAELTTKAAALHTEQAVAEVEGGGLDPIYEEALARKTDHLRINLENTVNGRGIDSGFGRYRFVHNTLPEIDLADVDCAMSLLGRELRAPLLISCMTGGTPAAGRINTALAEAAGELGIAMGLGSGRALLENDDTARWFEVRKHAPDALLFANLGAVQLNLGVGIDDCRRLVERLDADALVLHLNPLQEGLQPEGDTCFAGLQHRISELCDDLDRPVIVKEVGWGLSPEVVDRLFAAGVSGVDVAGAGGTSWSEVERHRLDEPARQHVASAFAGWGISTAESLRQARRVAPTQPIIPLWRDPRRDRGSEGDRSRRQPRWDRRPVPVGRAPRHG